MPGNAQTAPDLTDCPWAHSYPRTPPPPGAQTIDPNSHFHLGRSPPLLNRNVRQLCNSLFRLDYPTTTNTNAHSQP